MVGVWTYLWPLCPTPGLCLGFLWAQGQPQPYLNLYQKFKIWMLCKIWNIIQFVFGTVLSGKWKQYKRSCQLTKMERDEGYLARNNSYIFVYLSPFIYYTKFKNVLINTFFLRSSLHNAFYNILYFGQGGDMLSIS